MSRRAAPLVWGGLFAAGTAYELYALRSDESGDTLSECLRALFRVQSPVGKVVFTGVYLGFSAWFVPHIAAKAAEHIEDAADAIAAATSPSA